MDKNKTAQIRLSPSELGKILLDDFCPRCFWFTKKFPLQDKNPFSSPMPGIVSIADCYIKNIVKWHFKNYSLLPSWILNQLNRFFPHLDFQNAKQVKPGKWKINLFDNSCILMGQADEVLELPDGSWFIIDYKTASITESQKKLRPLYEAQLNAYAYLAQKNFERPIAGLALLYFDPEYKNLEDDVILYRTKDQFLFGFKPVLIPIKLMKPEWIENLCRNLFEILSSETPPEGIENCQGCKLLLEWLNKINNYLFIK